MMFATMRSIQTGIVFFGQHPYYDSRRDEFSFQVHGGASLFHHDCFW